ncbi:MAG: penicillin-binding protein [Actinobacteria bacterium]|nr:penicillin-binding protein [Actinomycetota bacterium]
MSPSSASTPWYRRFWEPGVPWYKQKKALALLTVPGLLLAFALILVFAYLFVSVPLPEDIASSATRVLDRNGEEIGVLSPVAKRQDVELSALPEYVPQAVMAAEDRNFYEHSGISVRGTVRALFTNVRAGEIEQGGSTITQQYIKNAAEAVGTERTFARKGKEAVLALKMERQYSKDEILEHYLNTVYLGRGAHGFEAAAQTYFNGPAHAITLNHAATLAGMIQSPSNYDPLEDTERVDRRRRYVLDGMLREGWITQAEHDETVAAGVPPVTEELNTDLGPAAYYLKAVEKELAAELGSESVYTGLTVTTEMDSAMQKLAQDTMKAKIEQLRGDLSKDPPQRPEGQPPFDPAQVTGALVSVDPADGGVRALVGGPSYNEQNFNAALGYDDGTGRNQPGSAFKPFGLAGFMDEGNSPESRYPAPPQITLDFSGEEYEVSNFANAGFGTQTVREATLTSTNTVFVQIAEEIGPQKVQEMGVDAGIPEDWLSPNPSLVLGTSEVSVKEMAGAYATFANSGARSETRLVRKVEGPDGEMILDKRPESEGGIDANVAHAVSDILEQNIQSGTGRAAQIGRPAAGKTGTTQESQDAWFIGYVPQLSTAVWFGTLDDTSMGNVTGGSIPAATWGEYMAEAVKDMEVKEFPEPDYSELEARNPAPSPAPTQTEEPSPEPTTCPDGEGGEIETILPSGEECPSPSPSPSESASPSPSPTETTTLPTESETESESPSPSESDTGGSTSSPTPTASDTTADAQSGDSSPSPTPTESATTSESPSPG